MSANPNPDEFPRPADTRGHSVHVTLTITTSVLGTQEVLPFVNRLVNELHDVDPQLWAEVTWEETNSAVWRIPAF